MPGRGRPKKGGFKGCSKKLNFRKEENLPSDTICNEQNTLMPVNENDDTQSDIIATPILTVSSIEQAASTSGSNMNNYFVPVTDDIVNRKFPVKLENNAQVCFFNSICQIFYSMPKFLAKLKYTPSTNKVVISMQDILETMKVCNYVIPYSYIHRIDLNDYTFGTQHDAQEALGQILDKIYPENILLHIAAIYLVNVISIAALSIERNLIRYYHLR